MVITAFAAASVHPFLAATGGVARGGVEAQVACGTVLRRSTH